MATTVAAYGKVKAKAQRGETMPEGWMIDRQGKPLTDPKQGDEGFLLPIGGYKGYGLALIVGLLAGTLNGAAMGSDVIDFNRDDKTPPTPARRSSRSTSRRSAIPTRSRPRRRARPTIARRRGCPSWNASGCPASRATPGASPYTARRHPDGPRARTVPSTPRRRPRYRRAGIDPCIASANRYRTGATMHAQDPLAHRPSAWRSPRRRPGCAGRQSGRAPIRTKPIHLIVPLAAAQRRRHRRAHRRAADGGEHGQSIVVENLPGAAGLIGADRVAKSAPDGYTIGGFNDSIMTMLPKLHPKMPWDILRDFEPVSLVATVEWGLVVNPAAPYKTAADLIAAAKANPGKINYGSGGNGSPQHIAMAVFATTAGISLTHVPYKGATQAALGVAGPGQCRLPGPRDGELARSGRQGAAHRGHDAQAHAAVPGRADGVGVRACRLRVQLLVPVMAPARTPEPIVARLNAEIVKALADPAVREQLIAGPDDPRHRRPKSWGSAMRAQLAKYARL